MRLVWRGEAFREVWRQDGMALMETQNGQPVPTSKVHFGYTDGISTPTIRGGPEQYRRDHQRPCEPWLFVLREDVRRAGTRAAAQFGLNGSFAVFKKVETDVVGFENFLESNKDKIDPELLAAKMCGRWRNGVPLALSPGTDSPTEGISPEQLNNFEYVDADGSGDPKAIPAVPSAHTYAASTHAVNQSRARGCPAAATIPTVSFVAGCHMGRRMIHGNPTMASSVGCSFISSTPTSKTSTSSFLKVGQ